MPKSGRVVITPHAKAEPDLDKIVLAILANLDDLPEREPADDGPEPAAGAPS